MTPDKLWEFYPTLNEFKLFFQEYGLPPDVKPEVIKFKIYGSGAHTVQWEMHLGSTGKIVVYTKDGKFTTDSSEPRYFAMESKSHSYLVTDAWRPVNKILTYISDTYLFSTKSKIELIESFLKIYSLQNNQSFAYNLIAGNTSFPHDSTLPQAAFAYALDFWFNYKHLHPYLWQCNCCGRFWIKTPKKFCGKLCNDVYHKPSKQTAYKAVKNVRESNKEYQREEDCKELIKWLKDKEGYSNSEATERANYLIYECSETFKNYKRRAIKWGL